MSTRVLGKTRTPRRRASPIGNAAAATSALAALREVLGPKLDLLEATDLQTLIQALSACCLAPDGALRFDGHFDLGVDMLVYLPPKQGGVLGLVHVLPRAEADFVARARATMEGAVQLRQLLLEKSEAARPPQRALQVELLLLVPPDVPEAQRANLAREFNHVARHTQYLRLVGLNLLALPAQGGSFEPAALRRAFCWLLRDTRAWFDEIKTPDQAQAPAWELTLNDYRLAGMRRFAFGGGAGRLHLVHGHNGSGKSTLVEALELLLTHKVQRLDRGGQTPYHPAIGHRPRGQASPASGPATAELKSGSSILAQCVVDSAGQSFGSTATAPVQRAQSFRIDQVFMNDLVSTDQAGRAQLFLEAFAPGDTTLLADVRSAEEAFEQAWSKLPEALLPPTPQIDTTARLRWAETSLAPLVGAAPATAPLPWTALLPLPETELALLAPGWRRLAPQLSELAAAPAAAAPSLLSQIDGELAALRDALPALSADLRIAVRVMEEFMPWEAAGQLQRGSSFEQDLQRWLELRALADLAAKHGEVLHTLLAASAQGWAPDSADASALPPLPVDAATAEQVRRRAAELQQELNDARERLRAWQAPASPTGPARAVGQGASPARRHRLSAAESQALDRAGTGLPAAAAPEPLGQLFASALAQNQARTMVDAVIGRAGGLQAPLGQARAQLAAADAVLKRPRADWHTSNTALRRIKAVTDAGAQLQAARARLSGSFFQKLAEGPGAADPSQTQHRLQAAVNELLALATPARWDYSDVGLRTSASGGKPALGFSAQGESRADLLLNTAELSAFTLVLFLLLAPRVHDNPLRLLVLDDPLQNMDEMMVCTLARALSSLLAVFPTSWSVLAFFHGMDDMNRIREEAPAEVYHLPWARPLPAAPGKAAPPAAAVTPSVPLSTSSRPPQSLTAQLLALAPA
jgi:energy-coupling factor transporter ATP-binding protein EcfA2